MSVCVIADPGACWRVPGEPYERSWERMLRLVDATKDAGAQVFKPQYYRAELLYPDGSAEQQLVRDYELPAEWLARLKAACDARELEWACTIYDPVHVPLLDPHVRRWKVASFENEHGPLLAALRRTGKPVIISLGGMSLDGIRHWPLPDWWEEATLLQCVSAYPAPPGSLNLRLLLGWNHDPEAEEMGWPAWPRMGLSDHSLGSTAAVMAVALGATVIEKHLRAGDTPPENPDYPHSASPEQFRDYVRVIREAELMLGDGHKRVQPGEATYWRWDSRTGRRGAKAVGACP